MSTKAITLRVSNCPGKKPITKLPATIQIDATTTVDDAKKQISSAARITDFNRIAILDVSTKAIFKDRKALLAQQQTQEVMVKDLGRQISWRTVFVIEYAGPIFIHLAALFLRPYIYHGVKPSDSLSPIQLLSMGMFVAHYVKRELETLFVHKFSSSTMPFSNVFKNSFHYWILGGLNAAYWVYSPTAIAAKPITDSMSKGCVYAGLALYVFGELSNFNTHLILSRLRSPGGTERGIPRGFGFDWVTCPNYLFEIISWIGVLLVTRSLGTAVFIAAGWNQMQEWSQDKERRYRSEFGDKYKAKRYPLTPGVPASKARKSTK